MTAPEQVGPYRIERVIATGGMGEVYEAWDTRLERRVAVKRIRPDRLAESERDQRSLLERFRREAKSVAGLSHPSIVQLHDLIETESGDWLVMELAEGESLASLVTRTGPLGETETRRLGAQIAGALAAAHARGIVHRDLKTENVIVAGPAGARRAKILDFGVAKRLASGETDESAELTRSGSLLGTHRAMSPEQSRGRPLDGRSDLFSLGVLLYEMASGESPFRADGPAATLTRLRSHRQEALRIVTAGRISRATSDLVDLLLEKDPALRPRTADEIARRLAQASEPVDGDETFVGEPTVGDPAASAARPAFRSGSAGRGVAALVLVAVATSGWLLWTRFGAGATDLDAAPTVGEAPIYVAVAAPWSVDADAEVVAEALHTGVLDGLLALDGLAVIEDDSFHGAEGSSFREQALTLAGRLAADEAIASDLRCGGLTCRIRIRRLAADDGRLLWNETMELAADDVLLLSESVATRLRAAYPTHPLRSEAPAIAVGVDDFREFLELSRAHASHSLPFAEMAIRLEALRARAATFPGLHLLEASVVYRQYFHSRRQEDLAWALDSLRVAQSLDPDDPQAYFRLARIALEEGRVNLARDAIERLESLVPGDARIGVYRALLHERAGRWDEALRTMRRSVELHPSWRTLYESARLEFRAGRMEQSRRDLLALVQKAPDQIAARQFLARIELVEGHLNSAEEQYLALVAQGHHGVAELSNLGLVRMLLGRYEAAEDSFRRALEQAPENAVANLNLADAVQLADAMDASADEAADLYREVVRLTEPAMSGEPTSWQELTVRAQALAHLGRPAEAASAIQRALAAGTDHPQIAYEACLVYSLLGESHSALASAEKALTSFGIQWFQLPWFDSLRRSPEFLRLVTRSATNRGEGPDQAGGSVGGGSRTTDGS